MTNDIIEIAIFAKAPIEGFAKTRLIPHLGAKRAADLQRRLIERTVDIALASEVGPLSIWCTPNCEHDAFAVLSATWSIALHAQAGDDLGLRMLNVFQVLTPQQSIMIIGTDCPVLQPWHLIDCAKSLREGADAVFLPTEDGGYALVGAAKPLPSLFLDMPWGTDRVMPESRLRARRLGLRIAEPAVVWDIDTAADYERASASGILVINPARTPVIGNSRT
jgi:rSAM/selenodomain-associated transferase 1